MKKKHFNLLIIFISIGLPTLLFGQVDLEETQIPNSKQMYDSAQINDKIKSAFDEQVALVYDDKIRVAIDNYWKSRFLKSPEFLLCCAILVFAGVLFAIYAYMLRTGRTNFYQVTRLIIITLIIISTLFLITAGYDKEQILSAMGLFGTIAGYILGKSSSNTKENDPQN
jgi:hypothetical protein